MNALGVLKRRLSVPQAPSSSPYCEAFVSDAGPHGAAVEARRGNLLSTPNQARRVFHLHIHHNNLIDRGLLHR